jgi:hypothetical protein
MMRADVKVHKLIRFMKMAAKLQTTATALFNTIMLWNSGQEYGTLFNFEKGYL